MTRGTNDTGKAIGAYDKKTVRDLPKLINKFKERGLYVIGRVIVFKDNLLAESIPTLAIKKSDGSLWRNTEDLGWTDPYSIKVRDYNIGIALEGAKAGFDEINFDYIRFPGIKGLIYQKDDIAKNRVEAINGFLKEARELLLKIDVKTSVDTFGYVCWNRGDTMIGHKIADLGKYADYVCPMLYPSSFHLGIDGYKNPMKHPYRIVYESLKRARKRTGYSSKKFRPWLQAFNDYGFDKRRFEAKEIRAQINGAEDSNSSGWMLWHPGSYYTQKGLKVYSNDGFLVYKEN